MSRWPMGNKEELEHQHAKTVLALQHRADGVGLEHAKTVLALQHRADGVGLEHWLHEADFPLRRNLPHQRPLPG